METIDVVIPALNAEATIEATLSSVLNQDLAGYGVHLIVVDDGSHDHTSARAARFGSVTILRNPMPRGRAAARNQGARTGNGRFLVFMDSDCVFVEPGALRAHVAALMEGADVSVGPIRMNGSGFWPDYQRRVATERQARSLVGVEQGLTSANVVLRRTQFEAVDGFDERYVQYGFEDRDFFLRLLSREARLQLTPHAAVSHDGRLTMGEITKKMFMAGRTTSRLFMDSHPDAYANTPFARVDTRLHGKVFLTVIVMCSPLLPTLTRLWDHVVHWPLLPFWLKRWGVKALTGLAYASGTAAGDN